MEMASEGKKSSIPDSTRTTVCMDNFTNLDGSNTVSLKSEDNILLSGLDHSLSAEKLDMNVCESTEFVVGEVEKFEDVYHSPEEGIDINQNEFVPDYKNHIVISELPGPPTSNEPIEEISDVGSTNQSTTLIGEIEEKICEVENLYQATTLIEEKINFNQSSSLFGENCFLDCTQIQNDRTPSKSDLKINMFKRGICFTSTPLHFPSTKKEMENLSIIKEEEEENSSSELENPKVTVIEKITEQNNEILAQPSNEVQMICGTEDILDFKVSKNITDLSILRKDQLSLLIDVADETLLKDKKNDFSDQNLTLTINNNESVVYKNIIDKSVDELLLKGGELIPLKELNHLETKPGQIENLKKAASIKEFISTNPEENRDNDDPEWELLKKLETDDERYKAVRKLWRNITIPDLKQNLSTFNWRKKNSLPSLKTIKPLKIDAISKKKKKLNYDCTEVFDIEAKNLIDLYHRQSQGIMWNYDVDTSVIAAAKKKPRMEPGYGRQPRKNYQDGLKNLNDCINERLLRLDEGKEEIKALHSFYNGLKNQGNGGYGNIMLISHSERRQILDIENMINRYSLWYRDNSK